MYLCAVLTLAVQKILISMKNNLAATEKIRKMCVVFICPATFCFSQLSGLWVVWVRLMLTTLALTVLVPSAKPIFLGHIWIGDSVQTKEK